MTSIELKAPAKVNIFLKVLNKRSDSYHDINTLFESVSLSDTIRISKTLSGITISSDKFITRSEKDNLMYRSADLILRDMGVKCGVAIRIIKRIPIGGGLGGGSSDAASVILGMNKLFHLKLPESRLLDLASKIGADVPFFILRTPFAFGRSRGERLNKAWFDIRLWHLIVYPGFGISTKAVYEAFDRSHRSPANRRGSEPGDELSPARLTTARDGVRIHSPLTGDRGFHRLESMLYNDLERITIAKKRVVGNIIKRLASLGKKAIVSGSGPSVFCLFKTRKEALRAARRLLAATPAAEKKGWQVFIASTMSRINLRTQMRSRN